MSLLTHITLATGHTAQHRLDTIDSHALELTRGLLPSGGPVPNLPAFRVEIVGPVFTLFRGREPLLTCGVGKVGAPNAESTWQALCNLQERFSPVEVAMPKRGAWLCVALLPSIAACARDDVAWMGDFERCLAATILELKNYENR